jgi:hypothetical protein
LCFPAAGAQPEERARKEAASLDAAAGGRSPVK